MRTGDACERNERNADMARQMTIEDRKRIDFLLQLGWTPVQIAREMGRSKSTIIREIVNRSVECDRGYRCVYSCNGAFTFARYEKFLVASG